MLSTKKDKTMSNTINQLLMSKEEKDALRKKEQLRKDGETFIRVFNYGPDGYNYIHAIEDKILIEYNDPDTGRPRYEKKTGSSMLIFETDEISGERMADVLDTEFNRFFLSRHLEHEGRPFLVVESKKIAREIKALVNKEFVVEPTRKQKLSRQKVEIERDLKRIQHEEEKMRKNEREEAMRSETKIRTIKPKEEKENNKQPVLDAPDAGV